MEVDFNIEESATEISPELPSGHDLEYDGDFLDFEQELKGKPETQVGDSIIEATEPNWKSIKKTAVQLLQRTKDLRICVPLCHALLCLHAYEGLLVGIKFIAVIIERYWTTVHPQLDPDDDNDPLMRINILEGLNNTDFLRDLRNTTLFHVPLIGAINLRTIDIANGDIEINEDAPQISLLDIKSAIEDMPFAQLQGLHHTLNETIDTLNHIETMFNDYVNNVRYTISFSKLREMLVRANRLFSDHLKRLNGSAVADTDEDDADAVVDVGHPGTGGHTTSNAESAAVPIAYTGAITSRQGVLEAFNRINQYYAKYEPSSPVPLIARRAERLVQKNFHEILLDLLPDSIDNMEIISGKLGDQDQE